MRHHEKGGPEEQANELDVKDLYLDEIRHNSIVPALANTAKGGQERGVEGDSGDETAGRHCQAARPIYQVV